MNAATPLSRDTVNFIVALGVLSSSSAVTNSSGYASVTLTLTKVHYRMFLQAFPAAPELRRAPNHFRLLDGRRGRCFAEIDLMMSLRQASGGMGTLARFRATFIKLSTSGSSSTLASGWPAS